MQMNVNTIRRHSRRFLVGYGIYLLSSILSPFAIALELSSHGHEVAIYIPDGDHVDIEYSHCDHEQGELCKSSHEHKYHLNDELLSTVKERVNQKSSVDISYCILRQEIIPYSTDTYITRITQPFISPQFKERLITTSLLLI
jgi:hypothetical protein